ncbi:MAG TPA: glycosyltransferase family 4 protein [Solirubrobacterales bacterium]|nr:glycosyltransferase family 4 protein [Solirubrobacterales bacterium]
MKIAFLLPGQGVRPTGGYKVVYEYANRLTRDGHEVSVVHPFSCAVPVAPELRRRARIWVAKLRLRRSRIAPWFEFEPGVDLRVVTEPAVEKLPDADVLVATAWHTAAPIAAAVGAKGAGGAYLIQGYETWDGDAESVDATWRLPLAKIVISHWLEEIAERLGEAEWTTRVPLGMDLDRLGVDVPPAERAPRLGSLHHPGAAKGGDDVLAAMAAVKERRPEVCAVLFGTRDRPADLPDWIEYEQLPSPARLRALFNSCSIFLGASRSEGWGLPASEAMLCGCALVTVANGGSREFAIDGETALVVPPERVDQLGERALALLDDEPLRLKLAAAGAERLRGFTWERSVAGLEAVLERAAAEAGRS